MTVDVRGWVATRTPPPPPALAAAVERALGANAAEGDVAAACLRAAEDVLARVLADDVAPGVERAAARDIGLDLLAADALVTYAFEAAADTPETLDALAREAMARLSRVAPAAP